MKEQILACIDGSMVSKEVCKYALDIAQKLNLPLILLNVIENSHTIKQVNLSGNIGLGARDDLQEILTNEEFEESKDKIKEGKKALKDCEDFIKQNGNIDVKILQRHGDLDEILEDFAPNLKLAIMGLSGEGDEKIGTHVKDLVRSLNIAILLVYGKYKPIESILMAYDGSAFANKSLEIAAKNPIFKDTKRYIVNVNKNKEISQNLLKNAENILKNTNFQIELKSFQGEAVSEILKFQEEQNIDIIAMGAFSQNRFKSIIFGSFTTKMLQNCKSSLLLFR